MINVNANRELNGLVRIDESEINHHFKDIVLLYPQDLEITYLCNDKLETKGLGKLDKKNRDLIRKIKIINPLNLEFEQSNILMPRTYAESLVPIPQHISVQAIILSRMNKNTEVLLDLINRKQYGKHEMDKLWVGTHEPTIEELKNRTVYILNRRIGGWDGSIDRPVIELLGAGGHLPTIWNSTMNKFETLNEYDLLVKEVKEELNLEIMKTDIEVIGGFHNKISNELVFLACIYVDCNDIISIYNGAIGNYEEDTDGIYIGFFKDVIEIYMRDSTFFAGGNKARPSNFPSQKKLLDKLLKKIT